MKQQERDELLIRLSERANNIWTIVEKMEIHLIKLNDSVAKNAQDIVVGKSSTYRIWWFIGIVIVALIGIGVKIAIF